ncbi:MAG: UDP-N-acetylglucosamine 2-epimerase (non-hydrolyzing) [Deltaproteobacteria bacterium]|nr:UDP-N-acetylglucosamine 2-epimerase (non-hydrolyzing) [Deltaproteobacteria bacterium]
MRILTIVGARPQFIKCSAVSPHLRRRHTEILVHTGQHHDYEMSRLFFEQLGIPEPDHNLGVAGGSSGQMTGRMMERLEPVVEAERPDWMVVYGDTNSTLAGALVGAKAQVRVAHVEAGLRSYNRAMPEEINRVVTDHVSSLLLCPTENAVQLLAKEGITSGVRNVGDVMLDVFLAESRSAMDELDLGSVLAAAGLARSGDEPYALATLHRAENTSSTDRLIEILAGLGRVPASVLLPVHPRTRSIIDRDSGVRASVGSNTVLCAPLGYREMIRALLGARLVLTDSGGLQKDAYFAGVPCVTFRDETEWVETVEAGANVVVGASSDRIVEESVRALSTAGRRFDPRGGPFGDGRAGEHVVEALESA